MTDTSLPLAAAAANVGEIVLFYATLFFIQAMVKAFVGLGYTHFTRRPLKILLYQVSAEAIVFIPLAFIFTVTEYLSKPLATALAEIATIGIEALLMFWFSRRKFPLRSALTLSVLATAVSALVGLLAIAL